LISIAGKNTPGEKGECSAAGCRETPVYQCKHCGQKFCESHLKAKPSAVMKVLHSDLPDSVMGMIDDEIRQKGGHQCKPYFDAWLKKKTGSEEEEEPEEAGEEKTGEKAAPSSKARKRHEPASKPAKKERAFPKKFIAIGLIIAVVVAASYYFTSDISVLQDVQSALNMPVSCNDGTPADTCSANRPFYCSNGTLVERATFCGCSQGYAMRGEGCGLPNSCSDRTEPDKCSVNKPLFCQDGTLVPKASLCGCPYYITPAWAANSPAWNVTTPTQFSNPKWYKSGLTFTISLDCSDLQSNNMRAAFSYVMNMTKNSSLRFAEAQDGCPDITVKCLNVTVSSPLEQGVAETVLSKKNEGYYSIIIGAEITLTLGSQGCVPPVTQIHQVLHALGFGHVTDSTSMLYYKFGCLQTFKDTIRKDIEEIYPR